MVTQRDVEGFVRATAKQMVTYLQSRYETPDFNPLIKVSFAQNRKISYGGIRGGIPFINIVGKRFLAAANNVGNGGMMNEIEYPRFDKDPIIGGLYGVTWKKALACLVAHELGHAVQYNHGTKEAAKRHFDIADLDNRNKILEGHDWFWKKIYADLRVAFINSNDYPISKDATPVKSAPTPVSEPKPAPAPTPAPVQHVVAEPVKGALYVKYKYKGNATYSWFYVDQKLAVVIAEINKKFYRADPFGEVLEELPFKTLVEARRNLIGQ